MKTLLISFFATLCIITSMCAVARADVLGINTGETNLYLKPGSGWTDNRLTKGAVVELTGKIKDGWYPVRMRNGEEGWVSAWLAWPLPSTTPLPPAFTDEDIPTLSSPLYGRVVAENVSFRTLPYGGLSGKHDTSRSGFIPRGATLKITDRIGHWMKAKLSPTEYGWVYDESFEPAVSMGGRSLYGVPTAALDSVVFKEKNKVSLLAVNLEKPLPWSVVSNVNPDVLMLSVYGVDCSSLRWRWYASCAKSGGWCECREGKNVLEAFLPSPAKLAGYDVKYSGNNLLLSMTNPKDKTVKRIVIDPGHGAPEPYFPGYAEGASAVDCTEKEAVMSISGTLAGLLRKAGFDVFLTRDGDSADMLDLYRRVEFAEKMKADLFVSVHANGDTDTELTGVEIYWYDPQNRPLAEIVADSIVAATGQKTGIAAFGSFAVIRPTRAPSILVETGYMSNKDEGKLLCDAAFQKKSAAGIAAGIMKYVESIK